MHAQIFLPARLKVAIVTFERLFLHVLAHVHYHVLFPKGRVVALIAFERLPLVMEAQRVSDERLFLRRGVIAHFAFERFVDEVSGEMLFYVLTTRCRVIAITAFKVRLLTPIVFVVT